MGKHVTPWSPLIHTSVNTHLVPVTQLVGFNTIVTCLPPILSRKESIGNCCCCSVTQSCPTLCDPMDFATPCSSMDCTMPGFSVLHCLLEFAQIHVHWASDGGFPDSSVSKESMCNAGDQGSIPGLRRSSGEGKGYPLQFSGLENSMDCIVHGVTETQTWLSDFQFTVCLLICVLLC